MFFFFFLPSVERERKLISIFFSAFSLSLTRWRTAAFAAWPAREKRLARSRLRKRAAFFPANARQWRGERAGKKPVLFSKQF